MHLINRLPALLAAIFIACAPAAPLVFATSAHAQAPAPAADSAKPAEAKPADAPKPPPAAAKEKETIENPYGLEALWKQGDFVSKGTLVILVIMSMGSWYIMFVKVYEQHKLYNEAKSAKANFWSAGSVADGGRTGLHVTVSVDAGRLLERRGRGQVSCRLLRAFSERVVPR